MFCPNNYHMKTFMNAKIVEKKRLIRIRLKSDNYLENSESLK